jgi:hypothetical protein
MPQVEPGIPLIASCGLRRSLPPTPIRSSSSTFFQTWVPDSFQTIPDKWVAAGESVAELAGDVAATIAKAFTGKRTT